MPFSLDIFASNRVVSEGVFSFQINSPFNQSYDTDHHGYACIEHIYLKYLKFVLQNTFTPKGYTHLQHVKIVEI